MDAEFFSVRIYGTLRETPTKARSTIDGLQWPCTAYHGVVGLLDDEG